MELEMADIEMAIQEIGKMSLDLTAISETQN